VTELVDHRRNGRRDPLVVSAGRALARDRYDCGRRRSRTSRPSSMRIAAGFFRWS
jgi:hypothetical protein